MKPHGFVFNFLTDATIESIVLEWGLSQAQRTDDCCECNHRRSQVPERGSQRKKNVQSILPYLRGKSLNKLEGQGYAHRRNWLVLQQVIGRSIGLFPLMGVVS